MLVICEIADAKVVEAEGDGSGGVFRWFQAYMRYEVPWLEQSRIRAQAWTTRH